MTAQTPDTILSIESEIRMTYARSSGKGGQNVNKVNTKAVLFWDLQRSRALLPLERELVRSALSAHVNNDGVVVLTDSSTRSQEDNRRRVIDKLLKLVNEALRPRKKRISTKPSRASKQRRRDAKKFHSRKKQRRRVGFDD